MILWTVLSDFLFILGDECLRFLYRIPEIIREKLKATGRILKVSLLNFNKRNKKKILIKITRRVIKYPDTFFWGRG